MKPFDVEWETEADDQLAEIWTTAVDRNIVTRAAHEIDRILESDPLHAGVPLSEGLRKLTFRPLIITYSVDVEAARVEVARVRKAQ